MGCSAPSLFFMPHTPLRLGAFVTAESRSPRPSARRRPSLYRAHPARKFSSTRSPTGRGAELPPLRKPRGHGGRPSAAQRDGVDLFFPQPQTPRRTLQRLRHLAATEHLAVAHGPGSGSAPVSASACVSPTPLRLYKADICVHAKPYFAWRVVPKAKKAEGSEKSGELRISGREQGTEIITEQQQRTANRAMSHDPGAF